MGPCGLSPSAGFVSPPRPFGPFNNHFSVSCKAPSVHPPPPNQPSRLQPSASSFCKTLSHQSQGTFASLANPHRALREASREALSAELSLLHLLGPAEWRSCQQLWTGTCYFLALCLHLKIGRVPHVWWVWRKAECFYENLRAARLHPVNTADRPEPRR